MFAGYDRKISSLPSQPTFNNSVEAPFIYRVQLSYIRDFLEDTSGAVKVPAVAREGIISLLISIVANEATSKVSGLTYENILRTLLMFLVVLAIIHYSLKILEQLRRKKANLGDLQEANTRKALNDLNRSRMILDRLIQESTEVTELRNLRNRLTTLISDIQNPNFSMFGQRSATVDEFNAAEKALIGSSEKLAKELERQSKEGVDVKGIARLVDSAGEAIRSRIPLSNELKDLYVKSMNKDEQEKKKIPEGTSPELNIYLNALQTKYANNRPELLHTGDYLPDAKWEYEAGDRNVTAKLSNGFSATPLLFEARWQDSNGSIVEVVQEEAQVVKKNQFECLCLVNTAWGKESKDFALRFTHPKLALYLYELNRGLVFNKESSAAKHYEFWFNTEQKLETVRAYILANRAGKGEEMKDALFKAMFVENKDITSELQLGDIGKSVGLGDEFVTALKNGDAIDEADANINLAESIPVDETPTIIINGNLKVTPSMTNADATQMANNLDTIINSLLGSLTPVVTSTIYVTPIATPVPTTTITQTTTVTAVATSTQQISVTIPPTVKENPQINWALLGGGAILVILLGGILLRMRKPKDEAPRGIETVKSDIHVSDHSDFKSDIKTSYMKESLEILRGYSVLQNNDIKFGIRLTNKTGFVVTDADVILDYTKSLFSTKDTEIQHLGNMTPDSARTATYLLKPLGCIHNEQINALITYKDHTGKKQTLHMRPKEVHCVCPFLKEKPMSEGEYSRLAAGSEFVQEGISFKGISVEDLAKFMGETCRHMLHKVREYDIEGKKVIYLSGESVGEKTYYLLTAVIQEYKGLTQVVLRARSDKKYGLNGFMNEMADSLRHLVGSVQNTKEIGIIENTQVINIIDSVVQRTNFNMGEGGSAKVNIKDSVVQRSKIGKE